MEDKGSTSAHDGSTTEEGVFFLHLATNYSSGGHLSRWGGRRFRTTVQRWMSIYPHTAINKELPIITLDKFVKYYGVSYTGTGFEYWL